MSNLMKRKREGNESEHVTKKRKIEEKKRRILLFGFGRVGKIFFSLIEKNYPDTFFWYAVDKVNSSKDYPKVNFVDIDLKKIDADFIEDFDIVLNLLPCSFSPKMVALVKDCKKIESYFDLSTMEWDAPEQSQLKNAAFSSFVNMGVAPGIDNIMVKKLVDAGAKKIDMYFLEHCAEGEKRTSWCEVDAILGGLDKPIRYVNGKKEVLERFSGEEKVKFNVKHELNLGANKKNLLEVSTWNAFNEEMLSLGESFPKLDLQLKIGGGEMEHFIKMAKEYNCDEEKMIKATIESKKHTEKGEPNGVFGVLCKSDIGTFEIIFPSTEEIQKSGKEGNHITYATAFMLFSFFRNVSIEKKMKGFFFPENLPTDVLNNILKEVKELCPHYSLNLKQQKLN